MRRSSEDRHRIKLATLLSDEHDRLEQWFEEITERTETGECRECDDVWDEFVKQLESHMEFEEQSLFPHYAARGEVENGIAQTLQKEHAAIRKTLAQIGVELQLHLARAEVITPFLETLRGHARRERESLYPWLAVTEERLRKSAVAHNSRKAYA